MSNPKPLISVVLSTYQRAHLLKRSIECYNLSNFDLNRLELVVIDDASTDETEQVVNKLDSKIDLKYIKLRKPVGQWRDAGSVINNGIRAAFGDVIVITHPEMMVGRNTLQATYDNVINTLNWVSCRSYYLKPTDQEQLDNIDWRKSLTEVRKIPDFYAPHPGNEDYHPTNVDRIGDVDYKIKTWESWVFSGATRKFWSIFGGVLPCSRWGVVDLNQHIRRALLGIKTITPLDFEALCIHQNHDINVGEFKVTDRDLDKAMSTAPVITSIEQCCYPAVNEIGWGPICI